METSERLGKSLVEMFVGKTIKFNPKFESTANLEVKTAFVQTCEGRVCGGWLSNSEDWIMQWTA